jgi:hypothetical protein
MPSEDITVKFGADMSALDRGLRGVSSKMKTWSNDVLGMFRGFGASIIGALSIGSAMAAFSKLSDHVEKIRRISESTSLSTDMVQNMVNLGKASGVSAEKVEAALSKFTKGLAPGSNADTALRNFIDKVSSIRDPGERARFVMDGLGESGVKLIPILKDGSIELERMAAGFKKLSEGEMKTVEKAQDAIEQFTHGIMVGFGLTDLSPQCARWCYTFAKVFRGLRLFRKR